jgi:DNA-binding GntR family transcriptional regulator
MLMVYHSKSGIARQIFLIYCFEVRCRFLLAMDRKSEQMRSGDLKKHLAVGKRPPHYEGRKAVSSNGKFIQAPNRKSLAEAAYGRLLDMLRSGELCPNDLINERHLARHLDISRTPLREAVRRLEGEKILERQSSGTLVVRPVSIEDLLYICQVRRLVEGEAARRAAGRISIPDLERLRRRIVSHKESKNPMSADERALNRDLHLWIAEACGNPILASIIDDLKNRTQLLRLRMPARTFLAYEEHLAIVDALIKADGDEARAAMQRHIDAIRTGALEQLGAL